MTTLTDRQSAVYHFIAQRISTGIPPTVREIGAEFGISSPNGVRVHLAALERKGWIERDALVARGIRLTQKPGRLAVAGTVKGERVCYRGAQ